MRLFAVLALSSVFAAPAAASVVVVDRATTRATRISGKSVYSLTWESEMAVLAEERSFQRVVALPVNGEAVLSRRTVSSPVTLGPGGRSVSATGEAFVVYGPDGHQTGRVDAPPVLPDAVSWSADGRRVALLVRPAPYSSQMHLVVVEADSGAISLRTQIPADSRLARQAFAPDASALVIGVGEQVVRVDVLTGTRRTLRRVRVGEGGAEVVWGAADRLAVQSGRRLLILHATGRQFAALRLRADEHLTWTPDGASLSYVALSPDPDPRADLPLGSVRLVRAVPGARARTLQKASGFLPADTAWSPSGRLLALASP